MVTISESKRRTPFQPTTPTTDFPVGFPIFDNDDLRVWVNGAVVTAYTVSATYVQGVSEDAVVHLTGSGVTGDVIIEGNREPRRTDQYRNGAPLKIEDHNYSLNRIEITLQELHRDSVDTSEGLAQEKAEREVADDLLNGRIDNMESVVNAAADRAETAAIAAEQAKEDTQNLLAGAQDALQKAETAVQPEDLGALAAKNKVAIEDIDATGTPDATTFLSGDGSFKVPSVGEVADNSVTVEKLATGTRFTFTNRAALRASNLPSRFKYDVRTAGYASPGDLGGARWDYWGAAEPNLPSSVKEQDAGGNWWVMSDKALNPRQFGAKGDGITDDTAAINMWLAAAAALRRFNAFLNDGCTYRYTSSISVPAKVRILGDNVTTLQRGAVSTGEVQLGSGSALRNVVLDANNVQNVNNDNFVQIRVGASADVSIKECSIGNSSGYAIVINDGARCTIQDNVIYGFYTNGVAAFMSYYGVHNHRVLNNRFHSIGWAAVLFQRVHTGRVSGNVIEGTLIGGRNDRFTVNTSGSTVTRVSGAGSTSFDKLLPGQFFVMNNGQEFRIVSIQSSVALTVAGTLPSLTNVQASAGIGDAIGLISCAFVDVEGNHVYNTATYGIGCSTMGLDISNEDLSFRNNIIHQAGKNAISISKDTPGNGQTLRISILGNKIVNAGFGGGIGTADRFAILLQSTSAGTLTNILVDGNTAVSYAGEGQTTALFGKIGSVVAGDYLLGSNVASGTTNGVGS